VLGSRSAPARPRGTATAAATPRSTKIGGANGPALLEIAIRHRSRGLMRTRRARAGRGHAPRAGCPRIRPVAI